MYILYYVLGIVMIPGIALAIWAQTKVYTTFNKFNKIETKHGKSAKDVTRFMLDVSGNLNTKIQPIDGELTDHYNPTDDTVSLSSAVYGQNTIGAVGVAAHEVGHVIQHKSGYTPIKTRNILSPVIRFSSFLSFPLIFIGFILEAMYYVTAAEILIYLGIGIYALNVIFCLITLPIELNASKRATKILLTTGEMDSEEVNGVKQVLSAAAWTYVAALITSLLALLRLVLFVVMMRGKK